MSWCEWWTKQTPLSAPGLQPVEDLRLALAERIADVGTREIASGQHSGGKGAVAAYAPGVLQGIGIPEETDTGRWLSADGSTTSHPDILLGDPIFDIWPGSAWWLNDDTMVSARTGTRLKSYWTGSPTWFTHSEFTSLWRLQTPIAPMVSKGGAVLVRLSSTHWVGRMPYLYGYTTIEIKGRRAWVGDSRYRCKSESPIGRAYWVDADGNKQLWWLGAEENLDSPIYEDEDGIRMVPVPVRTALDECAISCLYFDTADNLVGTDSMPNPYDAGRQIDYIDHELLDSRYSHLWGLQRYLLGTSSAGALEGLWKTYLTIRGGVDCDLFQAGNWSGLSSITSEDDARFVALSAAGPTALAWLRARIQEMQSIALAYNSGPLSPPPDFRWSGAYNNVIEASTPTPAHFAIYYAGTFVEESLFPSTNWTSTNTYHLPELVTVLATYDWEYE